MNKIGQLLDDLHDAETDLAHEYRVVAERQAAEQDVYYLCHTLAEQADAHAAFAREVAEKFGKQLSEPGADRMANVLGGLRHKTSELMGRRPEAGLLLLTGQEVADTHVAGVPGLWPRLTRTARPLTRMEHAPRPSSGDSYAQMGRTTATPS